MNNYDMSDYEILVLLASELNYRIVWPIRLVSESVDGFSIENSSGDRQFFTGDEKYILALAYLRRRYTARR